MNKDCLICDLGEAVFGDFAKTKKDVGRPYDHFRGGIAPRSLLCVGKRRIVFSSKSVVLLLLGPMGIKMAP